MKLPKKAIKAASYVSSIFAIAAAMLLVVLLVLSITGTVHPRARLITLKTDNLDNNYDGNPLRGGYPTVYNSTLYEGHSLMVLQQAEITLVGEIPNAPVYCIQDETGADVTHQYKITEDFGTLTVHPRPITLRTTTKTQRYSGETLAADKPILTLGSLVPGHSLVYGDMNALIEPGTVKNQFDYRIEDENGVNMSDQYEVTEKFGSLSVLPIPIYLHTDSAQKVYDGTPLKAEGWKFQSGTLLEGHTLTAETVSVIQEVGRCENLISATVRDANGTDMSHLYEFSVMMGSLEILPIPLTISTGSAEKVYDGTPLSCEDWSLTSGMLEAGASLVPSAPFSYNRIGVAENTIAFRILDRDGKDISGRYNIQYHYGTLSIQPRSLTIQTGSAQKVYDGNALICSDYTILSGSLMPQDRIILDTVSFWGVGYAENLVLSCVILREENGTQIDVTNHYRVAFRYGVLQITAN